MTDDTDSEFDLKSMAHEDRLVLACLADATGTLSRSDVARRVAMESLDKDAAKYRLEKYVDKGFIEQSDPADHHTGLQHELKGRGRRLGRACLEYTDYETTDELTREELLESVHELSAKVVDLEERLDNEVAALREEIEARPGVDDVEANEQRLDTIDETVKPELVKHLRLIMYLTYNRPNMAARKIEEHYGGDEFDSWLQEYEPSQIGASLSFVYGIDGHDFEERNTLF